MKTENCSMFVRVFPSFLYTCQVKVWVWKKHNHTRHIADMHHGDCQEKN